MPTLANGQVKFDQFSKYSDLLQASAFRCKFHHRDYYTRGSTKKVNV